MDWRQTGDKPLPGPLVTHGRLQHSMDEMELIQADIAYELVNVRFDFVRCFAQIYVCEINWFSLWNIVAEIHDVVIKSKHFPRYWSSLWGIHRSLVTSPHKGQWRGAFYIFFDLRVNKPLSKQSWGWWFETPARPYDVIIMSVDQKEETRRIGGKQNQRFSISYQRICNYRKTSSISRTKFQNLNVSCIILQLSSPNPLKPGVKLRMKM